MPPGQDRGGRLRVCFALLPWFPGSACNSFRDRIWFPDSGRQLIPMLVVVFLRPAELSEEELR